MSPFRVKSKAEVDAFYRAGAEKAGAADNGAPGVPRPQYTENYYALFRARSRWATNIERMITKRESTFTHHRSPFTRT